MQSDLRMDFGHLLSDTVQACGAREMVGDLPSLHSAWDGEVPLSAEFRQWYLMTFLGPQEARRVLRGIAEIPRVFGERNQAAYERGGEASPLPLELIAELQRRVLVAMYPSAYEVAAGALHHPASRVAQGLLKLNASEARWRERYS